MQYLSFARLLAFAFAIRVAASLAGCAPGCELDAFGRQLTFPYKIVSTTVFATTTNIIYFQDLKGSQIISTITRYATPPPKPTFTWKVSGVTLTYPTTYVIYTRFVHSYLIGDGQSPGCETKASALRLGNSTSYSSLIYPAASITGTLPPALLVDYLESIPTVFKQLGGPVNSSCDPVTSSTSSSTMQSGALTLTTTNVLPSATVSTQTVSVPAQFDSTSGSSLSVLLTTPRFLNTSRPTTQRSTSVSTTTEISLSIAPVSSSLIRGTGFASASSSAVSSALSELSSSLSQASTGLGSQSTAGPGPSSTGGFTGVGARQSAYGVAVTSLCVVGVILGVVLL